MEKIDSSKISVVIQGPLRHRDSLLAKECIESIKCILPDAELIFSTWQDEEVQDLPDGIWILLKDPGGHIQDDGYLSNLERQRLSTYQGIMASSREFVLKFRFDLVLTSDSLMLSLDVDEAASNQESRIITTNLFIRNYFKFPALFHPSDLVQFGTKVDLMNYWSSSIPVKQRGLMPSLRLRPYPEQSQCVAWLEVLDVSQKIALNYAYSGSLNAMRLWESVLLDRLHIIDWRESGVKFPTRFTSVPGLEKLLISLQDIFELRESRGKRSLEYKRFLIYSFSRFTRGLLDEIGKLIYIRLHAHSPRFLKFLRRLKVRRLLG